MLDENQEIKSDITILKNGREIRFLAGLETDLDSGDEISIFPIVAGGNQTV
ncbi:MAG: MoaD/ThiS family protein [Candidatus Thorarchaeota archaeon]|jgi:molybdopterin synthase sulfur carrier subunit